MDQTRTNQHIPVGALDTDKAKPLLAPPGVSNTFLTLNGCGRS